MTSNDLLQVLQRVGKVEIGGVSVAAMYLLAELGSKEGSPIPALAVALLIAMVGVVGLIALVVVKWRHPESPGDSSPHHAPPLDPVATGDRDKLAATNNPPS